MSLSSILAAHLPARWLAELPAPPAVQQRLLEVADMVATQSARTPDATTAAMRLDNHPLAPWLQYLREYGKTVGPVDAARGALHVSGAMTRATARTFITKLRYSQPRPFQLDTRIVPLDTRVHTDTSFPSGHAASAWAAAESLAAIWPERANNLRATATAVGNARIYSGVHLPSDVAAGKTIGIAAAQRHGVPA